MAQAYAMAGAEDLDLSGLFADNIGDDDREEMAQFILDHPAPPDKAKYLQSIAVNPHCQPVPDFPNHNTPGDVNLSNQYRLKDKETLNAKGEIFARLLLIGAKDLLPLEAFVLSKNKGPSAKVCHRRFCNPYMIVN